MYQSAKAHPGPSQASKVNLFVRKVNVFNTDININIANYFRQKYFSIWPALTQAIN